MSAQVTRSDTQHKTAVTFGAVTLRSRFLALLLLLLLSVQFILGIVTNLFIEIPTNHPGSNADDYFVGVVQGIGWALTHGAWSLQIHVIVGLLLLLTALLLLFVAYTTRERVWMIVAPIGFMGILGAGFNGASFINYGHDFSSLLMAVGFLLALVPYLVGLYMTPRTA